MRVGMERQQNAKSCNACSERDGRAFLQVVLMILAALEKNGSGSSLTVKDKKNDTANNYSLDVATDGDGEFNFFFKVENMKLLDGTYDVEISSKNISHLASSNKDVEYWVALEPESSYE